MIMMVDTRAFEAWSRRFYNNDQWKKTETEFEKYVPKNSSKAIKEAGLVKFLKGKENAPSGLVLYKASINNFAVWKKL